MVDCPETRAVVVTRWLFPGEQLDSELTDQVLKEVRL